MSLFLSLTAPAALVLASIGYGRLALRALGVETALESAQERLAFGFVVGQAILGWLLFFPGVAGWYTAIVFWGLTAAGIVALIACPLPRSLQLARFTPVETLLVVLLAAVLALDLCEALSPPADADTLSYHFALPKLFLDEGRVVFVPRAVSGAIPLLTHMTYGAALGMGGEIGLTLWTMLTGVGTAALFYVLLRREVCRAWALAAAIALLTTPAVLYGGGNGQLEIRCAGFVLAATALVVAAGRRPAPGLFIAAGLLAGAFAASKYFGVIFVAALGLVVLMRRAPLRPAILFGAAALAAGFQWYLWNWIHSGDPIFPGLSAGLGFPYPTLWTADYDRYFRDAIASGEIIIRESVFNWLAYPALATFNVYERFESGRTGMGILAAILLPVAVAGIAADREQRKKRLLILAVAVLFYTAWFFSGTTQRVRHLLPVYPLILLAFVPAAVGAARRALLIRPLVVAVAAVLAIQVAGQSLFSANYLRYLFTAETRQDFLNRNVPGANAVDWVNRSLPPDSRIGFMNRQHAYIIERPSFMIHPHSQMVVDARPNVSDGRKFVAELSKIDITHLLVSGTYGGPPRTENSVPFFAMIERLVASGCLEPVATFDTVHIPSRTLRRFGGADVKTKDTVLAVHGAKCPK